MKRILLVLIINFSVFATLLVSIEILGQIFHYARTGRFVFQDATGFYGDLFEFHPYLAGRLKKNATVERAGKRITTTSGNNRWTGSPENDSKLIRVAALGGSTTFGTGVTDSDTWPALLQAKLGNRFSVTNFGVPGYSTSEAIIQMALIVPESKPNFVILYEGWNDIRNYHETDLGEDYFSHGMRQYGNLCIPTSPHRTLLEKFLDVSATVHYASRIRSSICGSPSLQTCPTFNKPDPFVDRIYVRNLKTLKILSENLSCYTIFVPQILNLTDFQDRCGWSRHIEDCAMSELLHRFNLLMKSVCSNDDSQCIFLESILDQRWGPEDFVDNGHFSRTGGEKFAGILGDLILQKTKEGDFLRHAERDALVDESPSTINSRR